ncbi:MULTISPECIES: NAD(P)-dependent alcohol dehydrogenase [Brevibacterium]|uniref:NAD(P)-dependent alcohol dehydrogenase n=1 Tax=Brevibacterium aurantiacum TaxID=273384 RepID=A0A4Z0KHJ5_BREAU|nr:NAD(P)-dependent alcohol dehydrogenase [Brevibacterium aurantiacum]TGD37548.1 NAD(P)-dependent alcohol dehydrogenase [Brevibacterium aurantiacum]
MVLPSTMQGAQYFHYGPPSVLQVNEVNLPAPGKTEILVKVIASSVNRADAIARGGGTRLTNGLRFPKGTGVDLLGEVVALGTNARSHRIGDLVWGYVGMVTMGRTGTAAQYATIDERSVSFAPQVEDLEAAAALPLVAMTALQAVRNRLMTAAGDRILIIGASGGVGSAAVQISRFFGASVSAVSGASHLSFSTELGASESFSHSDLPSPSEVEPFDKIFDCAGVRTRYYRQYLKPGGKMVTISPGGAPAVLTSQFSSKRVSFMPVKVVKDDLAWISRATEEGAIRPIIDRRYRLDEIARAHEHVATAHTRGKNIVISTP